MRILIVESSSITKSTTIAHVRNAIEIYEYLKPKYDVNLVDLTSKVDPTEQYDIILYSAASFYTDVDNFSRLLENQKNCKIGWITNEFELFVNDFVKPHMTFMINNFDEAGIKKAHRHDQLLTTNLNTLIAKERNPWVHKKYDVCYYGTWRKYRVNYFKKYFDERLIVSTSLKNAKKFMEVGNSFNITERLSWEPTRETLNLFKASLYIEDTKTHEWFNYMANRFFEALFCNAAVFFDETCKNSIKKDMYEIDDYFVVNNPDELYTKVNNLDKQKLMRFLTINTEIALAEKKKTLADIDSFLSSL